MPSQVYEGQDYRRDVVVPAPQLVQVQLEPATEEDQQSLLSPSEIVSPDINQGQEEGCAEIRKAAGRKRSCEALQSVDENGAVTGDDIEREGTPPKRQRLEEDGAENHSDFVVGTPIRLEKRRSEELGDVEDKTESGISAELTLPHKRARTSCKDVPISHVLPSTTETPSEEEDAIRRQTTPTATSIRGSQNTVDALPL